MKFAVIQTGGKQYKVSEGTALKTEKITGLKSGDSFSFDKILLVEDESGTKIGTPYLKDAEVKAEVLAEGRGKKIDVVKYKAKSRYFKLRGHRQPFFKVKINSIKA